MLSLRPRILLACLLGLCPGWTQGAYTARKALELLVQSVPREVSSQIVAITGFDGDTEPAAWSFLVLDPGAPGKLREYQVREAGLRGPRTLSAEEAPKGLDRPLPYGMLPVDSHDVARIIDDAVILQGVRFARIDYQLCWRDKGPEPLWMATLVGSRGETLGHMFISSISGAVTHKAFYHNFPRLPASKSGAAAKPAVAGAVPGSSAAPEAPKRSGFSLTRKPAAAPPQGTTAQESPGTTTRQTRPSFFRRR